MAAELAGGTDKLTDKAKNVLDVSNTEWALILADDVLLLDPENSEARKIKNSAMIAIVENTTNAQTRNYILSEYLLDAKQVTLPTSENPKLTFATMEDRFVPLLPMENLHRIMAVSLNSSECLDKEITVGLQLTDMKNTESLSMLCMSVRVLLRFSLRFRRR